MTDSEVLAERFEAERGRLTAVARRMLGSTAEADDAVQEAWLRLSRTDAAALDNLSGWLTTVVSRVCLDVLRARRNRPELPLDADPLRADRADHRAVDPEGEALLADAVGPALVVVLDTLEPPERLAFVLHDLFAVPFDEVAAILDKSPAAVRQLASRARRRVQGRSPDGTPDPLRQREIVEAFLAASRGGDFDGLLSLLDPDAICRADAAAAAMGSPAVAVAGAHNVAEFFAGRAKAARPALLGGDAGLVWMHRGEVKVAFDFTIRDGVIVAIDLIADPGHLADLDIETLPVGAGL